MRRPGLSLFVKDPSNQMATSRALLRVLSLVQRSLHTSYELPAWTHLQASLALLWQPRNVRSYWSSKSVLQRLWCCATPLINPDRFAQTIAGQPVTTVLVCIGWSEHRLTIITHWQLVKVVRHVWLLMMHDGRRWTHAPQRIYQHHCESLFEVKGWWWGPGRCSRVLHARIERCPVENRPTRNP